MCGQNLMRLSTAASCVELRRNGIDHPNCLFWVISGQTIAGQNPHLFAMVRKRTNAGGPYRSAFGWCVYEPVQSVHSIFLSQHDRNDALCDCRISWVRRMCI